MSLLFRKFWSLYQSQNQLKVRHSEIPWMLVSEVMKSRANRQADVPDIEDTIHVIWALLDSTMCLVLTGAGADLCRTEPR